MGKVLSESYVEFCLITLRNAFFGSPLKVDQATEEAMERLIYKAEDAREIVAAANYMAGDPLHKKPYQALWQKQALLRLEDEMHALKRLLVLRNGA